MAVDEGLANRVRQVLAATDGAVEKRMFGGLAFLVQGNMSVGVHGSELIVRIDYAEMDDALRNPGVRIFDLSERPMKGWVLASPDAVETEDQLINLLKLGADYARTLPRTTPASMIESSRRVSAAPTWIMSGGRPRRSP